MEEQFECKNCKELEKLRSVYIKKIQEFINKIDDLKKNAVIDYIDRDKGFTKDNVRIVFK